MYHKEHGSKCFEFPLVERESFLAELYKHGWRDNPEDASKTRKRKVKEDGDIDV